MPQWVVTKYNLTSGFTFNTVSDKTYAAPWHAGMAFAMGYIKAALRLIEQGR